MTRRRSSMIRSHYLKHVFATAALTLTFVASAQAEMLPAPTAESLTKCDITDTATIKVGIIAPMTGPTAADASD